MAAETPWIATIRWSAILSSIASATGRPNTTSTASVSTSRPCSAVIRRAILCPTRPSSNRLPTIRFWLIANSSPRPGMQVGSTKSAISPATDAGWNGMANTVMRPAASCAAMTIPQLKWCNASWVRQTSTAKVAGSPLPRSTLSPATMGLPSPTSLPTQKNTISRTAKMMQMAATRITRGTAGQKDPRTMARSTSCGFAAPKMP